MTVLEPDLTPFRENAKKMIAATFGNNKVWMDEIKALEDFKAAYKK